jgi:hypothetical protein
MHNLSVLSSIIDLLFLNLGKGCRSMDWSTSFPHKNGWERKKEKTKIGDKISV